MLLSPDKRRLLRRALDGRLLAACYGAGVDSTAMLVALKLAACVPTSSPSPTSGRRSRRRSTISSV